jgi:recombination protein RecA
MEKNEPLTTQVKRAAKHFAEPEELDPTPLIYIPTGNVMLNLACSDKAHGGYGGGKMVNVIGDSSSGKTILALTTFAEAACLPYLDEYRFIYDEPEVALEFNIPKMFGKAVADRMESPNGVDDEGRPRASDTIEAFHDNVKRAIKDGRPFIYVLDSLDSISSKAEVEKSEEDFKSREAGKETTGSYEMSKPKQLSGILRQIVRDIKTTESELIIISQTRDKVDLMSREKTTRSGGRALKFYCTHEIWLQMIGKIIKSERIIGNKVKARVKKNKITGKEREVEFPIFYDYGSDSIGACINFLIEEKRWKKTGREIDAIDLAITGTKTDFGGSLVKQIEEGNLEEKLFKIAEEEWLRIEERIKLNRKQKYG